MARSFGRRRRRREGEEEEWNWGSGRRDVKWRLRRRERREPVAQRHQVVSDTLALLLFIGVDVPLGSRAAAPIGDEVL